MQLHRTSELVRSGVGRRPVHQQPIEEKTPPARQWGCRDATTWHVDVADLEVSSPYVLPGSFSVGARHDMHAAIFLCCGVKGDPHADDRGAELQLEEGQILMPRLFPSAAGWLEEGHVLKERQRCVSQNLSQHMLQSCMAGQSTEPRLNGGEPHQSSNGVSTFLPAEVIDPISNPLFKLHIDLVTALVDHRMEPTDGRLNLILVKRLQDPQVAVHREEFQFGGTNVSQTTDARCDLVRDVQVSWVVPGAEPVHVRGCRMVNGVHGRVLPGTVSSVHRRTPVSMPPPCEVVHRTADEQPVISTVLSDWEVDRGMRGTGG